MISLPMQYHLEVYERSFSNPPTLSVNTSTPLPTFSVGDFVEPRTFDRWSRPPASGETFRVSEVRHALWEAKAHVGYKLMICVEVVPER